MRFHIETRAVAREVTAHVSLRARTTGALSAQERQELGRSRRSTVPRSALANFVADEHRPDPVALLKSQDATRISELLPIRYGRMLASPFAFFRGAALIMASDLSGQPHTGLDVQLCSDAHLCNFGLFASPERNLVFDINDFDETLPGPWEWDVKRLVASLAVAGRANGFEPSECERVVRACARAYRERMRTFSAMRELDVWYAHTTIDDALETSVDPKFAKAIRRTASKAQSRDNLEALAKLTRLVDGRRSLASDPPLLVPIDELVGEVDALRHEQQMGALIDQYRESLDASRHSLIARFSYAGMARKVVGVGSVGIRAWVVIILGRDDEEGLRVVGCQRFQEPDCAWAEKGRRHRDTFGPQDLTCTIQGMVDLHHGRTRHVPKLHGPESGRDHRRAGRGGARLGRVFARLHAR